MAIKVDGILAAGKRRNIRICSQRPLRAVLQLHIHLAVRALGVDCAGVGRIIRDIKVQGRNRIHDHIAVDVLILRVQIHMAAIGTFISPAGCRRPEEDAVAFIDNIRAGESNHGPGVVHEEHIPVLIGDRAAVGGK